MLLSFYYQVLVNVKQNNFISFHLQMRCWSDRADQEKQTERCAEQVLGFGCFVLWRVWKRGANGWFIL